MTRRDETSTTEFWLKSASRRHLFCPHSERNKWISQCECCVFALWRRRNGALLLIVSGTFFRSTSFLQWVHFVKHMLSSLRMLDHYMRQSAVFILCLCPLEMFRIWNYKKISSWTWYGLCNYTIWQTWHRNRRISPPPLVWLSIPMIAYVYIYSLLSESSKCSSTTSWDKHHGRHIYNINV